MVCHFVFERLFLGFLFRVYLFLVHKLNFQIIFQPFSNRFQLKKWESILFKLPYYVYNALLVSSSMYGIQTSTVATYSNILKVFFRLPRHQRICTIIRFPSKMSKHIFQRSKFLLVLHLQSIIGAYFNIGRNFRRKFPPTLSFSSILSPKINCLA